MGLRPVMSVPFLACLCCTLLAQATNTVAETVIVSTIPIFPQIPWGQTSKDFQVLVRIEASPMAETTMRVPIDLVAVLDVGDETRLGLVKEAMKFVIRQLHDDDRLAFVGRYTSTEIMDISGDGRINAHKKVDELEAPGGAQSTSGLEEVIKVVKLLEERPESSNSRASFIILVTDGEDSTRFQSLPREVKHPVHTFGFGASHDPKALLVIAKESHGTYSFVDDQNLHKITHALAICLGGLNTVVAVDTRVSLDAAEGSGVKIQRIESGGYNNKKSPNSDGQTAAEVTIGVLYAGEVKSFIVHLHVPAPSSLEGGCEQQQLLTASIHHYGSDRNVPPIQAVLSVQRPKQPIIAVLPKVPIPMVVNHIVQFSVLEMVDNFVQKKITVPITVEMGVELGNELQRLWDEFVLARQFWCGLDLGGLESEINVMISTLQKPQAGGSSSFSVVSYIFSWVSSYLMQRPTAMGSLHNVVAMFMTMDMKVTLQQLNCLPPPPMFRPSGHDDNSYHLSPDYKGMSIEAINQAMNQMYLAVMEASNLKRCHSSSAWIEVQQTQIAELSPNPAST